jgi:hypothetical protein
MKPGDLVRGTSKGSKYFKVQNESVAIVIENQPDGLLTICWIGGKVNYRGIVKNFAPSELELIYETR